MKTYQDYEKYMNESNSDVAAFVLNAINEYKGNDMYQSAIIADKYNAQQNVTINEFERKIYKLSGHSVKDFTAANNRISSNFFRRLNTQRCTYSLGNGVDFSKPETKTKFGKKFDTVLMGAGYDALIHGVSYLFIGDERLYEFKATEFVPLVDEYTGQLRAGIRFWQLDPDKPLLAVFYESDGYTKFSETKNEENKSSLAVSEPKQGYIKKVRTSEADGEEVIGESNYSALPIVPLWGSRLHQSTLKGMRAAIDAFDLIRSGFANDLTDCAQIYWIIENSGGMQPDDLQKFLDKLKLNHIAEADTQDGSKITPYTQEIPYEARKTFLDDIRAGIYEDFGGLDVHTIAAGATNDHIDAAYQPLDENADDFEVQVIECIQQLGALLDIPEKDCVPLFKRNRISNQLEQVQMLTMAAQWLDEETVLKNIPFVTVDEIPEILKRKAAEEADRIPLVDTTEIEEIEGDEF